MSYKRVVIWAVLFWAALLPVLAKRLTSFGYVTCTNVPISAVSIPCNKIAIQSLSTNAASELIYVGTPSMNKSTGAGVMAILAPGAGFVVGDERDGNVFDANRDIYVDSTTGAGVVTGFAYQR